MRKINVKLNFRRDNSYDIIIGSGLDLEELLPRANSYVVVTDSRVKKLYASELAEKMKAKLLSFSAGEKNKNRQTKAELEDKMLRLGCGRDTMLIALGGGVVGDLAGFVASTYMRGMPYVQIPTTLLAMVDSSVGGKTAVDTPLGKNLIGAFWQPKKVVIDIDFLNTLSQEHLINGLIEAIKVFLTHDKQMFGYVEKNLAKILEKDKVVLRKIVERAIRIKAGVVERDEKEKNERMVLNFGHTIGHAVEWLSDYKLLHGQAVGLGILLETSLAQTLGLLSSANYDRIRELMGRLGIDEKMMRRYRVENILKVMLVDKKNRFGKFRVVMLSDIGRVDIKNYEYAHEVSGQLVRHCLNLCRLKYYDY